MLHGMWNVLEDKTCCLLERKPPYLTESSEGELLVRRVLHQIDVNHFSPPSPLDEKPQSIAIHNKQRYKAVDASVQHHQTGIFAMGND